MDTYSRSLPSPLSSWIQSLTTLHMPMTLRHSVMARCHRLFELWLGRHRDSKETMYDSCRKSFYKRFLCRQIGTQNISGALSHHNLLYIWVSFFGLLTLSLRFSQTPGDALKWGDLESRSKRARLSCDRCRGCISRIPNENPIGRRRRKDDYNTTLARRGRKERDCPLENFFILGCLLQHFN